MIDSSLSGEVIKRPPINPRPAVTTRFPPGLPWGMPSRVAMVAYEIGALPRYADRYCRVKQPSDGGGMPGPAITLANRRAGERYSGHSGYWMCERTDGEDSITQYNTGCDCRWGVWESEGGWL